MSCHTRQQNSTGSSHRARKSWKTTWWLKRWMFATEIQRKMIRDIYNTTALTSCSSVCFWAIHSEMWAIQNLTGYGSLPSSASDWVNSFFSCITLGSQVFHPFKNYTWTRLHKPPLTFPRTWEYTQMQSCFQKPCFTEEKGMSYFFLKQEFSVNFFYRLSILQISFTGSKFSCFQPPGM